MTAANLPLHPIGQAASCFAESFRLRRGYGGQVVPEQPTPRSIPHQGRERQGRVPISEFGMRTCLLAGRLRNVNRTGIWHLAFGTRRGESSLRCDLALGKGRNPRGLRTEESRPLPWPGVGAGYEVRPVDPPSSPRDYGVAGLPASLRAEESRALPWPGVRGGHTQSRLGSGLGEGL